MLLVCNAECAVTGGERHNQHPVTLPSCLLKQLSCGYYVRCVGLSIHVSAEEDRMFKIDEPKSEASADATLIQTC